MKDWQFIFDLHGQHIRGIASPSVGTSFVVRSGNAGSRLVRVSSVFNPWLNFVHIARHQHH
jgi:hypothetical protein